jgi:RNA polymerase sigma factor (TIGR02999 family)
MAIARGHPMVPDPSIEEVRALLDAVASGDADAAQRLFPVVYGELHRIASAYMRQERPDHTLQPTLRLVGSGSGKFENRRHFVAAAAVAMRRILVNHAKAKATEKRGGGRAMLALDDAVAAFDANAIDLLALDEALERLARLDPTQARLVELRFFGGMTAEQSAELLGISQRTVNYEWAHARAWLRGQLDGT